MLDRVKLEEETEKATPFGVEANLIPGSNSPVNYVPTLAQITVRGRKVLFSPWGAAVVLLALVAVFVAYLFNPSMYIRLGGGYDRPYLNIAEEGFSYAIRYDYDDGQSLLVNRAGIGNENYRWTRNRPILLLPGVGNLNQLQLRAAASPLYPAGQKVEVFLNGQSFTTFDLQPGAPKLYSFDLSKAAQNGSLAVEMRVTAKGKAEGQLLYVKAPEDTAYDEARTKPSDSKQQVVELPGDGFKLYEVWLTPQSTGLPPLGVTLSLVLVALGFYFGLAYCGLARPWAFGGAALLIGLMAVMLAVWRLELTLYAGRLALLMLVAALSLPLLDLSVPRLFRRWGVTLPNWAWTGLLALFLAGLLLRGGGILYPQAVVIDAPAHILEINRINQGLVWEQYTNRNLSKVPGQWNSAAIIPYSTVSYFLLAPFAKLPLDPNISVNLVNLYLDAARVFVIFALAVALGTGARAALVAAGIYLFVPCTWLMNSWGNWPTTLSFWMAVLYLTLVLVLYKGLHQRRVWFSLTALLTLTMMVYSVTAVFMVLLLYTWAAGLFFFVGRGNKLARRNGKLVFASATAASLGAVACYYWQFLSDLALTLTSFDQSLSSGEGLGLGARGFFSYLGLYTDHVFNSYGVGVLLALALTVFGWAIFAPRRLKWSEGAVVAAVGLKPDEDANLRSGRNLWLIGAWFMIFGLFGLAQWKVDMVDKQVWFTVPLICALASVALLFSWQKLMPPTLRYGARLAIVALTGWLTYSTISLWIYRIFFKRH